jgi:hypothetical protein
VGAAEGAGEAPLVAVAEAGAAGLAGAGGVAGVHRGAGAGGLGVAGRHPAVGVGRSVGEGLAVDVGAAGGKVVMNGPIRVVKCACVVYVGQLRPVGRSRLFLYVCKVPRTGAGR